MLVGGRNLGAAGDPPATFTLAIDGARRRSVGGGSPTPVSSCDALRVPAGSLAGDGPWADLTVPFGPRCRARPVPTAIEQFDLQSHRRQRCGPSAAASTSPSSTTSGRVSWRWMSERAGDRGAADGRRRHAGAARRSRRSRYFDRRRRRSRSGAARRCWGSVELRGDFVVRLGVLRVAARRPAGNALVLTTAQTFSPAERSGIRAIVAAWDCGSSRSRCDRACQPVDNPRRNPA